MHNQLLAYPAQPVSIKVYKQPIRCGYLGSDLIGREWNLGDQSGCFEGGQANPIRRQSSIKLSR